MPPKRKDNGKTVPWYDRALDSLANLLEADGSCAAAAIDPTRKQIVIRYSRIPDLSPVPTRARPLITKYFEFCRKLALGPLMKKGEFDAYMQMCDTKAELEGLVQKSLAASNLADLQIDRGYATVQQFLALDGVDKADFLTKNLSDVKACSADPEIQNLIERMRGQKIETHATEVIATYFRSNGYKDELRDSRSRLHKKHAVYQHDIKRLARYAAQSQDVREVFLKEPDLATEIRRIERGKQRHAELEVIARILKTSKRLPDYIGISKLHCALCAECFRDLYRRGVGDRGPNPRHPFFARGTHGERYNLNVDIPELIRPKEDLLERVKKYDVAQLRAARHEAGGYKPNLAVRDLSSSSSGRPDSDHYIFHPAEAASVLAPHPRPASYAAAAAGGSALSVQAAETQPPRATAWALAPQQATAGMSAILAQEEAARAQQVKKETARAAREAEIIAALEYGITPGEVARDGNCFYAAVARQVPGTSIAGLRGNVAAQLPAILQVQGTSKHDIDRKVALTKQDNEWAGQEEVQAAANALRANIVIFQCEGAGNIVVHRPDGQAATHTIALLYARGEGGNHYDPIAGFQSDHTRLQELINSHCSRNQEDRAIVEAAITGVNAPATAGRAPPVAAPTSILIGLASESAARQTSELVRAADAVSTTALPCKSQLRTTARDFVPSYPTLLCAGAPVACSLGLFVPPRDPAHPNVVKPTPEVEEVRKRLQRELTSTGTEHPPLLAAAAAPVLENIDLSSGLECSCDKDLEGV